MKVRTQKRLLLTGCVAIACMVQAARGEEPGLDREPRLPLSQGLADQARAQLDASLNVNKPNGTDWRYRKINGKWWYLQKNDQWLVFDETKNKWTAPPARANDYQEWRQQQFSSRYSRSQVDDNEMRRREVERWRASASQKSSTMLTQTDADYHRQIDRFHDTLSPTPYDYRIGSQGHGLFDCDPDRVIANSGRFNYATSTGGFMGGALRSPYGY
ncbi:MAG TPA: hypothetical protein VHC22_23165 [Pirellulales bacterium]|nr:hypothetical protein [Pirellulales bacterium]